MALSAEASEVIVARESAVAFLIELSFVSETKRIWTGFGPLTTSDARVWDGIGELARIEGLSQGIGTSAPAGKIVASGVSPLILSTAIGEVAEFKDRAIAIYMQPFLDRAVYGAPVTIALRIMKNMEISRDAGTRTIAINHEGPYTGRRRPAAGWYSDRDQQKRFPGDKACERTPWLLFKQEKWPDY